jgi:hypothetical protein
VVQDKRGPLLGKSGVVKEVDTGRDVVQVTFDGGVDMWWAAGCSWPPCRDLYGVASLLDTRWFEGRGQEAERQM